MKELSELKPIRDKYKMTFYPKGREISFPYSSRVLDFFSGMKDIAEIARFVQRVGIWDNFSVARGMDTSAVCKRQKAEVLESIDCLLAMLSKDKELYEFSYEYKVRNERYQKKAWSHCNINGKKGGLETYTGLLYFKYYSNGRRLDLRKQGSFKTAKWNDKTVVSEVILGKRRNHCHLLENMTELKNEISSSDGCTIEIRHHYV